MIKTLMQYIFILLDLINKIIVIIIITSLTRGDKSIKITKIVPTNLATTVLEDPDQMRLLYRITCQMDTIRSRSFGYERAARLLAATR